jgi:recombinational DNA repair protein (RecF pathway)
MAETYTRAGYPMHITDYGVHCGGCGADIDPGSLYGGNYSGMCICIDCIEFFEEAVETELRWFFGEDAATNDVAMLQMAKQEEEEEELLRQEGDPDA